VKPRYYLILSLIWLCMIWVVSSLPSQDIPQVNIMGVDKIAHFGVYLIWGMLVHTYLHKKEPNKKLRMVIVLLMFFLAALDEYHQRWIPGRDVSVYDLFANWSGLFASFLVLIPLKRLRR